MPSSYELSPVLPLGVCERCLRDFGAKILKTVDGGRVVGGYCPHNKTSAVLREFPDGSVGPWRMKSPVEETDVHGELERTAAVIAGTQASRRRESFN